MCVWKHTLEGTGRGGFGSLFNCLAHTVKAGGTKQQPQVRHHRAGSSAVGQAQRHKEVLLEVRPVRLRAGDDSCGMQVRRGLPLQDLSGKRGFPDDGQPKGTGGPLDASYQGEQQQQQSPRMPVAAGAVSSPLSPKE